MNDKILEQLREEFESLTAELTPEMEPAVVYKLEETDDRS